MRSRILVAATLLALATVSTGLADTAKPDYSKDAMLLFLREHPNSIEERIDEALTWHVGSFNLSWVPIVLPIRTDLGEFGSAQVHAPVNPFSLLDMDYPGALPERSLEGWLPTEVRYRSKMIRITRRANAWENRAAFASR